MNKRDIINDYLRFLRTESNARLSLIPGNTMDLPIYIYDGAHQMAKKDVYSHLNLDDEKYLELFDEIYAYFREKLIERDHFSEADDLTVEAVESGKFD
ncbi:MAG: hypothetical protein Q4P31_02335 [Andreesenia angusta]|nr:hypothetical protein [Andreesenia angusta]